MLRWLRIISTGIPMPLVLDGIISHQCVAVWLEFRVNTSSPTRRRHATGPLVLAAVCLVWQRCCIRKGAAYVLPPAIKTIQPCCVKMVPCGVTARSSHSLPRSLQVRIICTMRRSRRHPSVGSCGTWCSGTSTPAGLKAGKKSAQQILLRRQRCVFK